MSRFAHCLILLLVALPVSAGQSPLAGHPSPYLAMHAQDPVKWQLWDESILKRAKREKRLIFISSGYFACHWCHVMQRESFQNTTIAERLNRDFISVKIDRELWPELDETLINFLEKTRGVAGWPLNVFLSPEGKPIVGTTYLPADRFDEYLQRLLERWQADAKRLGELAAAAATPSPPATTTSSLRLSPQELEKNFRPALLKAWRDRADMMAGGFGDGAKFPQVPLLRTLMALGGGDEVKDFLNLTLKQMADNGLRDHLGGGFFRYTVDPGWQEPHFEKMLYDNAQLAALYLEAASDLEYDTYRRIGIETLDFLLREMRHPAGGVVSSLSAIDAQDVDGGYYLWSEEELAAALKGKNIALAKTYWGMEGGSRWERGYLPLPHLMEGNIDKSALAPLRRQLMLQRNKRLLPKDDKRLAAWNALALIALSAGYGESQRYVTAGAEVRNYLHQLWDGKRLWRMLDQSGKRWLPAGLQDYALTALALLKWDTVAGDEQSRMLAARLVANAWQRFYGEGGWLPGGETTLIGHRQEILSEGALPSAAVALLEANLLLKDKAPVSRQAMTEAVTAEPVTLINTPLDYSGYLILLQRLSDE